MTNSDIRFCFSFFTRVLFISRTLNINNEKYNELCRSFIYKEAVIRYSVYKGDNSNTQRKINLNFCNFPVL